MAMKGGSVMAMLAVVAILLSCVLVVMADGECSRNQPCPDPKNCCSKFGFCGQGDPYCGEGCTGGPCSGGGGPSPPSPGGSGLGAILTRSLYEQLFPRHIGFYSYDALIEAAKLFPQFGTTGDDGTKKREIAAYAAHATHETSGLTKINEDTSNPGGYCRVGDFCPQQYFGRGPLQLSWNYNYISCGSYLGLDLFNNPGLVATNNVISFKSSLWFWNKSGGDGILPHIHDVLTGNWRPSGADQAANRVPGFGVTINIINGGLECNKENAQANSRVELFKNFCRQLGVDPGSNLDCKRMRPFYTVNAVDES
ncbi:hypothetical protein M758_4G141100 [Ceratodon purpureus]|nr:hypothetical protein M758_4G141100 [Ceratodon purpureus]KAG0619450.1 hypothetical protein M758_4G141100 [Ceratodon purpureus]